MASLSGRLPQLFGTVLEPPRIRPEVGAQSDKGYSPTKAHPFQARARGTEPLRARPAAMAHTMSLATPMTKNRPPKNSICTTGDPDSGVTNNGKVAMKKISVFALLMPTTALSTNDLPRGGGGGLIPGESKVLSVNYSLNAQVDQKASPQDFDDQK